jgi:hypothetical protein
MTSMMLMILVSLLVGIYSSSSTSSASLINDFNAWFDKHDGVRVVHAGASVRYGGNGVIPRRSGVKGEVLIKLPLNMALHRRSLTSLGNTLLDNAGNNKALDDTDLIALALILIRNRITGFDQWFSWSELLPREFVSPLLFATEQPAVVALLDADTLKSVQKQRSDAEAHFATVLSLAQRHGVVNSLTAVPLTLENWLWAIGMVNSRAWALQGSRYLLPMADMFNFAPTDAQMSRDHTYTMRGDDFAATHKVVGDELHVLADRDFVAGEELFETYGDNPDSIYFQFHGFVPDVNPSACVDLPILLRMDETQSIAKKQILQALRVPRYRTYCVRDKRFNRVDATNGFPLFPEWLGDLVNVDRLGETHAKTMVKNPRYIWREKDLAESSSKSVQTSLHRWAVSVRDAYSTKLEEDEAALPSQTRCRPQND